MTTEELQDRAVEIMVQALRNESGRLDQQIRYKVTDLTRYEAAKIDQYFHAIIDRIPYIVRDYGLDEEE